MLKGRMAVGWSAELPRPSRSHAAGWIVIQEAAAWSGRGGMHPKPLQIHLPVRRAGKVCGGGEGAGHVPYPSPEATATRGHLDAEPVSGGGGCLAFL